MRATRLLLPVAALTLFLAAPALAADAAKSKENATMTESIKDFHGPLHTTIDELNARGPFPAGEENSAYARYFVGKSYLAPVSSSQLHISSVTFEPGCRNNWHTHTAKAGGGQLLIVTAGRGYYQEWGKPAQELRPGDVVHIPANVKHWHGASPNETFQHLAIAVPGEDTGNEWQEPVDAKEYAKLR